MINRKIFSLVLIAVLAFSLTACGSKEAGSTPAAAQTSAPAVGGSAAEQLADLSAQGFNVGCINYSDGVATVNFTNKDHSEFRQAVCTMTLKQCGTLMAIDALAEDYDQQCLAILSACPDLKVITPALPDASVYEAYVGKTVGDMEDEGCDLAGTNEDENGDLVVDIYFYTDDDVTYTVRVYPEGIEKGKIYDDDQVRDLVVGKVIFWEFS